MLVDLDTVTEKTVGSFSKGMRQRVKLAAALVAPCFLIFEVARAEAKLRVALEGVDALNQ